ncbi:hypothetical protein SLS62_010235 [Diatrype stigma]|uniref:Integral membrane protein n=1 Tax=Diatrype stigma TaxID=117547 RepID=A0AAN9YIQ2_9PEZI
MKSTAGSALKLLALAAIVAALPAVLAHGGGHDDGGAGMDMDMGGDADMNMDMGGAAAAAEALQPESDPSQMSYFAYTEHTTAIYAHIALMVVSWVVLLPIAVMFSIARSRYTLPTQFVFLATNAIGVVVGVVYNAKTPDLYPNNAHHKLGWLVTWVVCAQVLVGLVGRVAGVMGARNTGRGGKGTRGLSKEERQGFIPVSTEAMAEHHSRMNEAAAQQQSPYRHSHDDTEQEGLDESRRSDSLSTMVGQESPIEQTEHRVHFAGLDDDDDDDDNDFSYDDEKTTSKLLSSSVLAKAAGKISSRAWTVLLFGYNFVDRTILILGYITLCLGIVAFARFFAWNVRPKQSSQKWRPTAEFVEGFLIFLYGSTNIFLEHLGNAGKAFSSQDLEHVSITVLFIGGGALAMLIESTRIRELLNATVTEAALSHPDRSYSDEERETLRAPKEYEFSINPIPALVILLLGIMMSSHTQAEMISAMVHKQWGNLLSGASFARGLTYVIMYLKPPKSVFPSRPPTELLTAFGLIAGGTIFMASAEDTVGGMIKYELDEMFMYTVTMGFVGLLMAWVVLVLALKGWAVRKESARSPQAWNLSSRV